MFWEFVIASLFIISYWLIPMNFASKMKNLDNFRATELTIDFIIGVDVLLNLISESTKDMHVRKYLTEAAFAYLRTYLVVDVLSFLPGLVTWEQNSNLYYFKLCRFLRIKRFFSFFKYLDNFFCSWFQNNNKYKQIVLKISSILKLIFIYYFICHVFACIWLFLGIDGSESYGLT